MARGLYTGLEIQRIWVGILTSQALKERQCTPKREAQDVNVRGSVHWKGVYKVGKWTMGV